MRRLTEQENREAGNNGALLRWYDPFMSAVRLIVPLVVVLYAVDGHRIREYFSLRFLSILGFTVVGGSVVMYVAVGIALWRKRSKARVED
jgi:hypothetical protein